MRIQKMLLSIALVSLFVAGSAFAAMVTPKSGTANIRAGKSIKSAIVGKMMSDDQLEIMKEESGWYQVKTSSGKMGWVKATVVTKMEGDMTGDEPVDDSETMEMDSTDTDQPSDTYNETDEDDSSDSEMKEDE